MTSDIGAASTNIGLQWFVIALTVVAIVVAIWAALRASSTPASNTCSGSVACAPQHTATPSQSVYPYKSISAHDLSHVV